MSINDIKKQRGRVSKRPSEDELSMLYSGMTAKQLAEHYSVSVSTIKSWIAYYRKSAKEQKQ